MPSPGCRAGCPNGPYLLSGSTFTLLGTRGGSGGFVGGCSRRTGLGAGRSVGRGSRRAGLGADDVLGGAGSSGIFEALLLPILFAIFVSIAKKAATPRMVIAIVR